MMLRHFFVALVVLAMSHSSLTAQNFGYLNSAAILADMPEIKEIDSNLADFQKQLQKRREQLITDLQSKYQALDQKQKSGEIAPKILQEEADKLKAEEGKIGEYEQVMSKEYGQKREELLGPVLDRVNTAIKDVAKEGAYQYVFDYQSGILLYVDETKDVTNKVRAKLGMAPAAVTTPTVGGK